MSIGRSFKEALQKALRSLEIGLAGLDDLKYSPDDDQLLKNLRIPNTLRILYIKAAMKKGYSVDQINSLTGIDPWFLENIRQIIEMEVEIKEKLKINNNQDSLQLLKRAKGFGFSDLQLARLLNEDESVVRKWRIGLGVMPDYKLVDTCAAEFEAFTPYYYSTYE